MGLNAKLDYLAVSLTQSYTCDTQNYTPPGNVLSPSIYVGLNSITYIVNISIIPYSQVESCISAEHKYIQLVCPYVYFKLVGGCMNCFTDYCQLRK